MKNVKKIVFSVMLLILTLLLVSCGNKIDTSIKYVIADYSNVDLVFDSTNDVTEENFLNKIMDNNDYLITFYEVRSNASPTIFNKGMPVVTKIDEINQEFNVQVSGYDVKIPYLIYGQEKSLLLVSLSSEFIKFQKGATIDTFIKKTSNNENFKVDELLSDRTINSLDYTDLTFDSDWRTIINNKNFFEGNGIVTIKYENQEFNLTVRIDGGDDPLTWQTSGWWAKITAYPISWLTAFFASMLNNSFAFGIIITTIIIRTAAWPIYARSNDMSAKMNLAQPEMQRIQNKYALKKDPQSQQKMQMEMMQVYKKYGLGITGCLLPFLQMPIFMAMYQSVRRISIEGGVFAQKVSNTNLFGIDLSINGNIYNYLFAGLVGLTMFLLQKLAAKKPEYMKQTATHVKSEQQEQSEKTMRIVSIVMIAMMTLTAATSTALAFYWIIGNLYSIGQTVLTKLLQKRKYLKEHN